MDIAKPLWLDDMTDHDIGIVDGPELSVAGLHVARSHMIGAAMAYREGRGVRRRVTFADDAYHESAWLADAMPPFSEGGKMPNTMNPIVADVSHHNWDLSTPLDFAAAKQSGLAAIMIKATEGATYQDPKFHDNLTLARKAGLLCGAYHFGTAADVDKQVANFLTTIGDPGELHLALDFENNDPSPSNTMSKDQALAFLAKLEAKTGRKLTIYTGSRMFDVFGPKAATAFATHRVWWAQYGSTLKLHPTWEKYWLWQFTDGKNGPTPHKIAGLGPCDINTFDGTVEDLTASWLS